MNEATATTATVVSIRVWFPGHSTGITSTTTSRILTPSAAAAATKSPTTGINRAYQIIGAPPFATREQNFSGDNSEQSFSGIWQIVGIHLTACVTIQCLHTINNKMAKVMVGTTTATYV